MMSTRDMAWGTRVRQGPDMQPTGLASEIEKRPQKGAGARNLATGLDRIIVDRFLACLRNGDVGQSCFNIDLQ